MVMDYILMSGQYFLHLISITMHRALFQLLPDLIDLLGSQMTCLVLLVAHYLPEGHLIRAQLRGVLAATSQNQGHLTRTRGASFAAPNGCCADGSETANWRG